MNAHITKLFKNGNSQAVRIPKDMAFSENEVKIYREGKRIIIEAVSEKVGLKNLLASWQPLSANEQFPDIEDMPIDAKGAFD